MNKNTEIITAILKFISKIFIAGGVVSAIYVIIFGGSGYHTDSEMRAISIAMLACIFFTVAMKMTNAIAETINKEDTKEEENQ